MDDESDGLIQQGDQYRNVFYCQTIVSLAGQTEIYLLKLTFVLLLSLSNVGNAICFMTLAEIRINGLRAENFQTLLCSEGWQWLQETHLHMSQWHQYLLHSISTDNFSRSKFYISISIESTWTIREMEREVYFNNSRNEGMYISSFESQWGCIVLVQFDTIRTWQIFSNKTQKLEHYLRHHLCSYSWQVMPIIYLNSISFQPPCAFSFPTILVQEVPFLLPALFLHTYDFHLSPLPAE